MRPCTATNAPDITLSATYRADLWRPDDIGALLRAT
jgi:hypothetical protein